MIYLIYKHGFDNLENHEPHYFKLLGYCESEEYAKQKVSDLGNNTKKYKGYDGKYYPCFYYETVWHIDKAEIPQGNA